MRMWNLSRERQTPLPGRRDLVLRDLLAQADGDERACPRRVSTCSILAIDEEDDLAALFKGIARIKGTSLEASA